MINFFRRMRQRLLKKGNTGRYIKYAFGEIILVVIGILIALQINNWQQIQNDRSLENRYLKNLVSELQKDSIALKDKFDKLVNQSETKNPFLLMLKEGSEQDSLKSYFEAQWQPIYPYTPLRSTFEEMKSSSHLNIIKSDDVREAIIKMYNAYENLKNDEDLLMENFKNLVEVLSKIIPDIYHPSKKEILSLREDNHVMNSIRLNGAFTRRGNYRKVLTQCTSLLSEIRSYQKTIV
jgi:hypothetical protein